MNYLELYGKWRVHSGRMPEFVDVVNRLVSTASRNNPNTLRCDWFVHDSNNEAICMLVHRDADALAAHVASCGVDYRALLALASANMQWLGRPSPVALASLPQAAAIADFDSGQGAHSGANKFGRADHGIPSPHIEIYTRFALHPGQRAEFHQYARECLRRVIASDPGTSRYDWFYDDANSMSLALDTYNDPPSMFAHMKNCHEPHAKLLQWSTMTTEFLGELPPEALDAIRKYSPYVARFVAGLKPYSSGGFC